MSTSFKQMCREMREHTKIHSSPHNRNWRSVIHFNRRTWPLVIASAPGTTGLTLTLTLNLTVTLALTLTLTLTATLTLSLTWSLLQLNSPLIKP